MEKFKFYATDKLKDILDNGGTSGREEDTIRDILIGRWMKHHKINCLSPVLVPTGEKDEDGEDILTDSEAEFSSSGCDVCSHGLGNNVYRVEGYRPGKRDVVEIGDVCHECLAVAYNGVNP